ncbi:MAG TPA: xanthine dehydrogenase family protein molybdopterin-binding subunit [Thermoanaerobaculia bacterium]
MKIVNLSRRDFLKTGTIAGGGLLLGIQIPRLGASETGVTSDKTFEPNAFVRIGSDDSVTLIINHSEMGQGVYTSLAMILAEELECDWKRVRVEASPVAPAYNNTLFGIQMTGGSTSVKSEWDRLRNMGAAARTMLVTAAAADWSVAAEECHATNGVVIHSTSGRHATFGSLVEKAAAVEAPETVTLKDPAKFRLIGKATRRLDTPSKLDGSAVFGIDVRVPGMLVAVVARPPVFGAKLKSVDSKKSKAIPGVRHVVEIGRGVAVVADGFWQAEKGRQALELVWDEGALADLDSVKEGVMFAELADKPGLVARNIGDSDAALAGAKQTLAADYEVPYLAHAPMEPLNCVADVRKDSCEVWVGTQSQTLDVMAAARAAGLAPAQVKLHTTLLGGAFGRRAVLDSHFVVEAVEISKAVKAPVKVIWTREDDITGGFYRPRYLHRLRGGLDAEGKIAGWQQRIVSQSFIIGGPFASMLVKDGVDELAIEGASDAVYAIADRRVEWHQAPNGVPTLWWRSVGHSANAFVVESFLDELAHAAGRDPLEVRRELLKDQPRHLRVLDRAAKEAGWGKPLPEGRARGIAVHASFGSYVAQVAEVSVSKRGEVRVHRVVCAIDCGPIVNPDTIAAQMEGSVVFALSAALYGEITFEKGRVQQSNFHDYPVLRFDEMPLVETHIVQSSDSMGGVGEPAVPPVAPAVTNAIFALTGQRIRRLPIDPKQLAG